MFQKSFVVVAYPRTGSTLIIGNLNDYFGTDALQTHDSTYVPPHGDYTCVITKRTDIFATVCSHLIMLHTNEANNYTNKKVEPFVVDPESMKAFLVGLYDFYQNRNLSHYKKVIEIDFDQLISDPYYLFGQFNIVEKTNYNITKSPYRYQDLILNLDELKEIYNNYNQQL
jgi:hypothetical protein